MVAREQRGGLCSNRWSALRSRVMGCEEDRKAARSVRREAQQETRCWGCGVLGHYLWECPNKAAHPAKGKAQQKKVRSMEMKEEVALEGEESSWRRMLGGEKRERMDREERREVVCGVARDMWVLWRERRR